MESRQTEKWVVEEDRIVKELLDLTLDGYTPYAELFAVSDDYCTI